MHRIYYFYTYLLRTARTSSAEYLHLNTCIPRALPLLRSLRAYVSRKYFIFAAVHKEYLRREASLGYEQDILSRCSGNVFDIFMGWFGSGWQ